MEISTFFEVQSERDKMILLDETLTEYKVTARKYLELHTKLSSLADETKCYKYWISDDNCVDKDITFKKYINCLSHIIDIGIYKKYDYIKEITVRPNDYCLSDQFLNLYIDLNDLIISSCEDHFITLIEDFISLGVTLNYSENEIKEAFINI